MDFKHQGTILVHNPLGLGLISWGSGGTLKLVLPVGSMGLVICWPFIYVNIPVPWILWDMTHRGIVMNVPGYEYHSCIHSGRLHGCLERYCISPTKSLWWMFPQTSVLEKGWLPHHFKPKPYNKHMGVSKIGVPQNGWFIMENPIKMEDLGVPLFSETYI